MELFLHSLRSSNVALGANAYHDLTRLLNITKLGKMNFIKQLMKSSSACVYSAVRHRFSCLSHQFYCRYHQLIKSSLRVNLKYFFKFANCKRKISVYTSQISLNGYESSCDIETSNLFAEHFRRHFSAAGSDLNVNSP